MIRNADSEDVRVRVQVAFDDSYSETSLVAHRIRDEIRLIAPRQYLGVVYWDKKRLINFALQF